MRFRVLILLLLGLCIPLGAFSSLAQEATPAPDTTMNGAPSTMVLVERATDRTYVDSGEPESSIGDMLIWGPNALYDEANEVDTGAVVHGVCVWFNVEGDCLLNETITFEDGSTLVNQGIQPAAAVQSVRTIVGGSGRYLGATGTIDTTPSDDFKLWTRFFEIWQ